MTFAVSGDAIGGASVTAKQTLEPDKNNGRQFNQALARSVDNGALSQLMSAGNDPSQQVDYLNAGNIALTNGVTNNGDGSITIPAGVQSFTASVPVIDDSLIESTETAVLSVGSHSGIGQIFDNDSLPTQPDPNSTTPQPTPKPSPSVSIIDANSVTEGDGNTLLYSVELDRPSTSETSFTFSVSGDAIGAPRDIPHQVDYLTGDNVAFTNGVTNNGDGSIIPAGVQSFTASVPVIDDSLIESTKLYPLVDSLSGIGQIFDNDSLPLYKIQNQI